MNHNFLRNQWNWGLCEDQAKLSGFYRQVPQWNMQLSAAWYPHQDSGEASWEICSRAIFAFSRLQAATWFAQVSNKLIKYKPRSSDLSSLSHGYGDPKLGGSDKNSQIVSGFCNWSRTHMEPHEYSKDCFSNLSLFAHRTVIVGFFLGFLCFEPTVNSAWLKFLSL